MNHRLTHVASAAVSSLAVLMVLMSAGCKNKANDVVGTWKDQQGSLVTFSADKSFKQGTAPREAVGTWSLEKDVVTVRVETVGGQSADPFLKQASEMLSKRNPKQGTPDEIFKKMKAIQLTLSEDGKTLTQAEGFAGPGGVMNKVESK